MLGAIAAVFLMTILGLAAYLAIPVLYRGIQVDQSIKNTISLAHEMRSSDIDAEIIFDTLYQDFDNNGLLKKLQQSVSRSREPEYRNLPYRAPREMLRQMVTIKIDHRTSTLEVKMAYREIFQPPFLGQNWMHFEWLRKAKYSGNFAR